MTDRGQLGWRVPEQIWAQFLDFVDEKHGSEGFYIRFELESAMLEYLDEDEILVEAEALLRDAADLQCFSSSTRTDRYNGCATKLVNHRIRSELKKKFSTYADKHDAQSYGRLLAAALDSYIDGGRARRVLEGVKRVFKSATSSGSTENAIEKSASTIDSCSSTNDAAENKSSTESQDATSSDSTESVDPALVADAADELLALESADITALQTFPIKNLDKSICLVTDQIDSECFEKYRDRVLEQLNAEEHPHIDGMCITENRREEAILWADLDKPERIVLLRRWAVKEAINNGRRKQSFTYKEVISLFEDEAMAGPSFQYAYELMELAAEEEGFKYDEFDIGPESSQYQLRVDVSDVRSEILQWIRNETEFDPNRIGRIAGVTSYTARSPLGQQGAADD